MDCHSRHWPSNLDIPCHDPVEAGVGHRYVRYGAPCTGRYLSVFGFISIPTMAGSVFFALAALMLLLRQLDGTTDVDAPA